MTTPTVTGTGEAGDTVDLYDGSTLVGTGTVGIGGAWSIATSTLAVGRNILTATEIDVAGNVSRVSAALDLTIKISATSPSGLTLSPASDSGMTGDDITNVTNPTISGTGEAGDTVDLYDGSTLIGTGTVGAGGAWSAITGTLGPGTNILTAAETDVAGNISPISATLPIAIYTALPVTMLQSVSVAGNSGAGAIGIVAPTDANFAASALTALVTGLPSDGSILLSNGFTPVSLGETLTVAQLTGLEFEPAADLFGQSSSLTYSVLDPAGNTATGRVNLAIESAPPTPPPPAPSGLTLLPGSDSGVQGDDVTNVTMSMIIGTGVAGDSVTLLDGTSVVGRSAVAGDGSWAITTSALAAGQQDLTATETDIAGNVSRASASLTLTIKTAASAPTKTSPCRPHRTAVLSATTSPTLQRRRSSARARSATR